MTKYGLRGVVTLGLVGVAMTAGCRSRSENVAGSDERIASSVAALSGEDSGADGGAPASPAIGAFAVYATEALEMNGSALVSGCAVGVEGTTGPFLGGNAAAYFNSGAKIDTSQTLYAYSVYFNSGVTIGALDTDAILVNHGATYGTLSSFPAMPSPPALPAATAGTTSVTLNSGQSRTLAPGAYAGVTVNSNATLSLTGGSYVFSSLTMNSGGTLAVNAATTISVTGSASFGSNSVTGPAAGSGLTAQALVLYLDTSSSINLNTGAQIQALVVATNAKVTVNTSKFTGALAAAQVLMNSGATITCQDGFGSLVGSGCSGSCDDGNPCTADACSAGSCTHTPVANGTSCNDGNACTQTDSCQSGTCTGSNPVTCTAEDSCHVAGTCNPSTGVCSNPPIADGTACSDGNACDLNDTCQAGTCTAGGSIECTASDQCHAAGTCNPVTGACSNPTATDGTACNDGNACDANDTCQAGTCTAGSTVTCAASDQCHAAGTCNPATGACSNPTVTDGTACNDGNACDLNDACLAGTCTAGGSVTCAASDQCHVAGMCNPATGACSNPAAANGTTCNDGNACTQTDSCQSGVCAGANPVTCTASDQCHVAGSCNPSTGQCSNPTASNGTACNDGNACDSNDTCQSGACTAGNTVSCTAADQCHVAGTCNPSTGQCSNPQAANGTACNDGSLCDSNDSCQSGTCTAGSTVTCTAADQCHAAGTCNPATGACSNPAAADGTACNDGNACDLNDSCESGTCTAGGEVQCTASDQCHVAGTCDTLTGSCTNPAAANGTACNDGNLCDSNDTCQAGACAAGSTVTCTAEDQCHVAGTCNPATGACSNPSAPNGTACNDESLCTANDQCTNGACGGTPTVTCTAADACHTAGTCNPATGACSNPQIALPPPTSACQVSTCNPTTGPALHECAPVDGTATSTIAATASWLYSGANPLQAGVDAGTIAPMRAAVLRGQVLDTSSSPLEGITVSVVGNPQYGTTTTASDGTFTMAVNGGGALTVSCSAARYLTVQRTLPIVPWNQYTQVPQLVMTALDPAATVVNMSGPSGYQVARGTTQTDSSGTRTATLLIPPGTTASFVSGSSSTAATTLTIRATEYTVGPNGPMAMPGDLPKTTAYTYAAEFSADEAIANGSTVTFSAPIVSYTDDFLAFNAGEHVPVAYYNRATGQWMPTPDGLVIAIVSITGGVANIDITGDGVADSESALAAAGITSAEQTELAELYTAPKSLWRVSIPHFSPWDFNMGDEPPDDAGPPPGPPPAPPPDPPNACQGPTSPSPPPGGCPPDTSCDPRASVIECENGILHESIPLAGTPYSLVYSSDRVAGFTAANRIDIPLSGATMPPNVLDISLQVDVAGRSFTETFPASPNQTTTFDWDGDDAFGRALQGTQLANVNIGYVYQGVYLTPSESPLADGGASAYNALFGHYSYFGVPATTNPARQQITLLEPTLTSIGHWHAEALGLGGWTFNVQHVYEPATEMLRLGDGRRQPGDAFGKIVTTFAGTGVAGTSGDNGPATSAELSGPWGVSVLPDGELLIADTLNNRVQKVSLTGVVTTVAGRSTGTAGSTGDNGPATSALLNEPQSVFAAPDGSFYIADDLNSRIRYVNTAGIITTVAGNGTLGYAGNGGPATSAEFSAPNNVFLAADGSLYITDATNCAIRRVDPAGIVSTVAGIGNGVCGYNGDGIAAAKAQLNHAHSIVVTPDGRLIISDRLNNRIRMVGTNGIITTIAGNGTAGFSGDGGPAVNALISQPQNMALGPDGTIYFADHDNVRIRAIRSDGVITTIAGTGATGFAGDNGPSLDATFAPATFLWGLAVSGDGQYLYVGDGNNNRVRRLSLLQPGFSGVAFSIAAQDGSEVYGFDQYGRHLTTTALPNNAPSVTFGYDAAGVVQTITDASGNVTTVTRDSSGNPTGVVGPFGVTTSLAIGSDGYLANVTGPAGAQWNMTYQTGSLTSIEFPTGSSTNTSTKTYDSLGRVVTSTDAAGHSLTFSRAPDQATEVQVTKSTSLGVTTHFEVDLPATGAQTWTSTLPDGTTQLTQVGADGSRAVTAPDGTKTTYAAGPDPRFGMQVPLTKNLVVETPSGLTQTTSMTRAVTLSNASNPLSLTSETDTTTINGHAWTTVYNASTGTFTATTPVGRTTTTTINAAAEPTQIAMPNIAASVFGYDAHGRPTTTTQGTFVSGPQTLPRTWTQAYDANGYLNASTDPIGVATTYLNDLAGRPTDTFLPAGPNNTPRDLKTTYDGDDNLTSETLPNGNLHQLTYTPVDALASYSPPSLGSGTWSTSDAYDGDGRIQLETRPDGSTIGYAYDSAGRLSTTSYPQGMIQQTYSPTTGMLTSIAMTTGETLSFTYDGTLTTGTTWTGAVAGTVAFGYDSTFRITSKTVDGTAVSFGYDNDNLMTTAGAETITRDPQNGRVTGTTLGSITDAYAYDANGQLASYVAKYSGTTIYSETINTRDGDGRITEKTDFVNGVTHVWAYGYDAAGRLTNVSEDGTETAQYGYDADDNRVSYMNASGTVSATYDAQDRMLTYGAASYAYGANGELESMTNGGQTTTYAYDVFGNLLSATLPGGTALAYVVDGQNRRVGTQVNGVLESGFLYQDQLGVIAETNGSGGVTSRYVFGSKANVPDYYTTSAGMFRILSDHLGSPRLVVNSANGIVVEEVDYDEFGNVTSDTAPGTMPFGFAGGLYDANTGLVRLGARDYDPTTGRWTSKDLLRFAGGQINFYAYSGNEPINRRDPTGLGILCDWFGLFCPPPPPSPGSLPTPNPNAGPCWQLDVYVCGGPPDSGPPASFPPTPAGVPPQGDPDKERKCVEQCQGYMGPNKSFCGNDGYPYSNDRYGNTQHAFQRCYDECMGKK